MNIDFPVRQSDVLVNLSITKLCIGKVVDSKVVVYSKFFTFKHSINCSSLSLYLEIVFKISSLKPV